MASEKRTDIGIEAAEPDINRLQNVDLADKTLNASAVEATADEHSVGFIQGMKTYKKAAFWSIRKQKPPHTVWDFVDMEKSFQ
jgi:SP family general alpha glucoside:H+ symporter-like MFS transporter